MLPLTNLLFMVTDASLDKVYLTSNRTSVKGLHSKLI